MTVLYVFGCLVVLGGTVVALLVSTRKRGLASKSVPSQPLSDEQLQQIQRLLLREKILEKVSKRGLRGRPIL